MDRKQDRDRFICPRCRTHAEQTWLTASEEELSVRWSTCGACHAISIWRGPLIVYPNSMAELAVVRVAWVRDEIVGEGTVMGGLSTLSEALHVQLADMEATARATAAREDDRRASTVTSADGSESRQDVSPSDPQVR